jgi:ABC-2 type transport system permease protein
MRKTLIIARRELVGYFVSPLAYVIGALFLLACNFWFFHSIFHSGREASLRPLFESMAYLMVAALPLLTMRLISEELRSGTVELLMTAPVREAEVVVGKFLGVFGFFAALLTATVVPLILMLIYGRPDMGLVVMGYLGMILLGAMFAAVGIFASATTSYQLVSVIVAAAILSCMVFLPRVVVAYGAEPWNHMVVRFNAMTYFKDFASGFFDTRGVVFFVTLTVLFLYLSIKTLESRRWR